MSGKNNLTKLGIKTLATPDTDENVIQGMQVKLYEALKNCGRLGQYGLYGNAPVGSFVILMQINGQEEVLFGIEDDVNRRPRNLKEGEVMIYNTLTKNYIYLKEDGSTEVYTQTNLELKVTGSVNLTASSVNINGNVTVNGVLKATEVIADNGTDGTFANSVTVAKGIVTAGS